NGHVIASEHVTPYLVGYVLQRNANVPDPLLPYPEAGFEAEVGTTYSIYISVFTPAGTPPGEYSGEVTLIFDNAPEAKIPFQITVYDFELPIGPGHCRTAFALQASRAFEPATPETYDQYARFMLDHRLNPDDIYRHTPPRVEDLERWYELGLNYFTIRKVAR